MFANFIYLLIALILYTTCHYATEAAVLPDNAVFLFFCGIFLFFFICFTTFKRLEKRVGVSWEAGLDLYLDRAISRLSVLALGLFSMDLFLLKLKLLFKDIRFFQLFPSFEALIFMGVFIGYLVIIWSCAWTFQKRFFPSTLSKRRFIFSNISFALPGLLPWFIISITADIIQILPFDGPKTFLETSQGEIIYVLVFLFAIAAFGPFLIQKLWGCTPLESGFVRMRIEALCARANLKYADILKWELFGGSMITAGVMGLVARFRYILVTPALIRYLNYPEIDAVIAHEIGHVQKKHIHFYLFFFAGYIAAVYALFDPLLLLIYYADPLFIGAGRIGIAPETAMTLFFSMILISLFLVYFRYVFGFFMRNFERQADTHVYALMGDAQPLIATFFKISHASRQSPDKPNWHHFSISRRIGFLKACEADRSLIKKHDTKVKRMIAGYVAAMVLVCFSGYSFNFGQGKEALNRFFAEMLLSRQLQISAEDSNLYTLIGDYFYHEGAFEKAVHAYENVLAVDPENLQALNNLAWLFATASNPAFLDYKRALDLAKKAVKIDRAPNVLDTYAEACFKNKFYDEAVTASLEALEKAQDRQDYYTEQVKRFQSADPAN